MKKKFFNGILLVAALFATSSAFVSCKDNDADEMANIKIEIQKDLNAQIAALQSKIDALSTKISQVEAKIPAGCTCPDWTSKITELETKVGALQTLAGNKVDKEEFAAVLAGLNAFMTEEEVEAIIAKIKTGLTEEEVKALIDGIKPGMTKEEIEALIAAAIKPGLTEDEVKALIAANSLTEDQVKELANAIAGAMKDVLEEQLDLITKGLNNMVYAMVIEETYNPIFGAIAAPINMKSQVLAAYIGSEEMAAFHGQKIRKFFNGDAGNIYFTVNPNNVELNGTFSLINSVGETYNNVELSNATKSDKVLVWGGNQTRATETGLYEVKVTVKDTKDIELDYKTIGADIKNILSKRNRASVSALMTDLYPTLMGGKYQRLALNYDWSVGNAGTTLSASTRSPFDLAVMAVKPLSYDFDININHVPGYDKILNTVNKMINKIQIDFGIDFSKFENVSISLDRGTKDYIINVTVQVPVNQTVTVNVPDVNVAPQPITLTYTDEAGVSHPVTGTVPGQAVTVPPTAVELNFVVNANAEANINAVVDDLFKSLNGDLAKINDMLTEVTKLSKIETKIEDTKNDIRNEIKTYIDKFDSKIVNFINHFNDALQPTLLVKSGNTIKQPGTIEAGKVTLIPTSYTAEILAPAFMKYIKVETDSDVIFEDVVDGTVIEIPVTLVAGKTYKVTYDAIDFFGKTRQHEYTIIAK